jgi:ribosomal protein S18 acetylase RimI-like enzyme
VNEPTNISTPTKPTGEITVRPAVFKDADAIATIHWRARSEAMPWLAVVHSALEVRGWVARVLLKKEDVYVAIRGGKIVGFMAVTPGWLNQLYVHPDAQRAGVGAILLGHAKRKLPDGFHFWVFQKNLAARSFYEKHGATLLRETDGKANEEREPDAEYEWKRTV